MFIDIHEPTKFKISEEISQESLFKTINVKEKANYPPEIKDDENEENEEKKTKTDKNTAKSFGMDDDIRAFFISEEE